MSECTQNSYDFLRDVFSPSVAVLTSEDAEFICQKNDLSFVEMIRPFCQLSNEVHIRDPVNPNFVVPIKGFKVKVKSLGIQSPPSQLVNKILSEVVAKSVLNVDLKTNQSLETLQKAITPWFEAYRSCFFQLLKPSDHEFIRHLLACMIVVSTRNPDPMSAFVALSGKQFSIQQSTDKSNPYIKWFSPNTFKYYVLLHDVSEGHEFKADAVFQSMKSVYGSHTCFLLQINSKAKMFPDAREVDNISDPWSIFLYPFADETLDIKDDDIAVEDEPRLAAPGPKTQAEADKEEARILENFEKAEKMAEEPNFVSPTLRFQDPLTSMHYNENLENDEENDLGPLKPGPPDLVKDIPQYKRRLSQVKLNEYKKCIKQFTFEMLPASARGKDTKRRGQQLTLMDQDRIKTLMYEFCVRGLLPHIEKLMRSLSEQIMSRKGIHRSIYNVTKKWFGGSKGSVAVGGYGSNAVAGISYPVDSPELQQRKLGDLAFLVQHYELAFNSYHAAKREFNNDHAWLYFAGALEMAAISAFMQGPQKSYRVHYFEACISTYLNTCRLPDYATRACLMTTETSKNRGMFADAAFEFIKLTNELDCDLRSALLLEQAAHCYLHNSPSMIRKYAFHMILAGHRYSKAVQRKHTLRCYTNALNVYKEKGWHLAEDHMNFIIGRQCFNLSQLEDSQNALRKLLIYESFQPPLQQASHLREFLAVFKQVLEKKKRNEKQPSTETIPTLPLPKIDGQASRVILSSNNLASDQSCDTPTIENPAIDINRTRTIVAGQYSFRRNYNKNYFQRWSNAEKRTVEEITGSSRYPWRPTIPFLSSATDNSYQPICIVGETFSLEVVFVNPLRIPLNLLDLHLLWKFTPSEPRGEETTVSNKLKDFPEYITTDVIENFIVKAQERKSIPLNLKFHESGTLEVTGVKYILSSISVINAVDEDGKVDLNGVQKSTLLAFGVKGQQELTVKGPRLNVTKKEKTNVTYGADFRLNPRVLPPVPRLQAWMINFPVTLLCGEVRMTQFVFKNSGKTALKSLHISCNRPECFSLDGQSFDGDTYSKDAIYEMIDGGSTHHSTAENLSPESVREIVKVPLENGLLQPNAEISVPVWIHGMSTPGVHELDFLFYYEPLNHVRDIPYRVMHQTVRLQTLSTLNLSAGKRQTSTDFFKVYNEETKTEGPADQSLIGLHIENRAQGSAFPRCVEFTVLQVSCFSYGMKFSCLGKGSKSYQRLRPGEALLMYLKASNDSNGETGQPTVTHISFTERMIDGAKSPAIDFFSRTRSALRILDSNQTASARMGLVIFWQTSYIDDSCVRHIIYGQTHTGVQDEINLHKTFSPQQSLNSTFTATDYDIIDGRRHEDAEKQVDVSSPPIDVSLHHASVLHHDFSTQRICEVPIRLTLKNPLDKAVTIQARVKSFLEARLEFYLESNDVIDGGGEVEAAVLKTELESHDHFEIGDGRRYTPVVAWIGKTSRTIKLQPLIKETLVFRAVMVCPGTFNLNVFEFNIVDNEEEIKVKNASDESVIRVVDSWRTSCHAELSINSPSPTSFYFND